MFWNNKLQPKKEANDLKSVVKGMQKDLKSQIKQGEQNQATEIKKLETNVGEFKKEFPNSPANKHMKNIMKLLKK